MHRRVTNHFIADLIFIAIMFMYVSHVAIAINII